jgi:ketosteroid isomerase-like protein
MATEDENIAALRRMYDWANRVMGEERQKVTRSDVEQFFAADAEMFTNEQLKCRGIETHVQHFEEIQAKTRSLRSHPFEIVTAQGDRVGVYFKIDVHYSDGRQARILIAGFFRMRDKKIVNFTEVAHFEGAKLDLQNH